jgi:uncharacterized protein YbbK (DUF523 family)
MGGLPTPRPAAQRTSDGRVVTVDGADVTAAYERGAQAVVEMARVTGAQEAVLKARSPSCGCHQIYAGDALVDGDGVTAQALRAVGVRLRSEEDLDR